jgi:hypothetical protein
VNGITGKAPDYPTTRLALRTWQVDKDALLLRSVTALAGRKSWMAKAMSSPEGAWPQSRPLTARCGKGGKGGHDDPVPGADCSCGIYATTDLDIINGHLSKRNPVAGIVELGGRVIPATQGYRAQMARVAVILLLDEALTEPWPFLRKLAAAYKVPAVIPHSDDPEQYRELACTPSLAIEAEEYLRGLGE